jgi:hypothetical protein
MGPFPSVTVRRVQDAELLALVSCARELHANSGAEWWLVKPSAPVLFFGDLQAFRSSDLRVATVALNPSSAEFPSDEPFQRFPGADSADDHIYLQALSGYFNRDRGRKPLVKWFRFFEQMLLGLGASYYGNANATALHTDIGSVLATDPKWSSLGERDKSVIANLKASGVPLWQRLATYLAPHILLWSTGIDSRDLIGFPPLGPWETIHTFTTRKGEGGPEPRKRPIKLEVRWYQLPTGSPVLVGYVPAYKGQPAGALSDPQKIEAGQLVKRAFQSGNADASHMGLLAESRVPMLTEFTAGVPDAIGETAPVSLAVTLRNSPADAPSACQRHSWNVLREYDVRETATARYSLRDQVCKRCGHREEGRRWSITKRP